MPTIYVPTFAAFRGDVETMLSLLEKEVLKKYNGKFDIGLEIGGKPDHFANQENLEKIITNIKEVADGVKTVVHGFSGIEIYTEGIADMSKDVGKNLLFTYIDLAKKLGSKYVHVHSAAGYKGIKEPENKNEILKKIRMNLLEGLEKVKGTDIKIGIENIPSPSCCDYDVNPKTVWSDCVQGLVDCLKVVNNSDVKITLDVAHYGINGSGYINLKEPAILLGKYLNHLHVGDCKGHWEPNLSLSIDGIIPGDGRIGKDSFGHFFEYIREKHPDIGICLEVQNKDFKNPEETKESLKRVCDWLEA